MDIMPLCSFVGATFLLLCSIVGAYVVLRGAWAAVVVTWGRSTQVDAAVASDLQHKEDTP